MKGFVKHVFGFGAPLLAAVALLFSIGLVGACGTDAEDAKNDFDSKVACRDYCDKKFDCLDQDSTSDEYNDCVGDCRDSIEDNCGNDHQAAANDQIEECVDKGCVEFWACMIFDAAPDCFGFVDN